MKIVLVLLVILGLAGVALWQTGTLDSGISTDTISGGTFTVKRGDLSITLTERGTLKTRNAAQVRSQVEGRTPIQWLADEGKAVKQGDVETAKGLLRDAIETHPQHFETAVRSLRALEVN